MKKIGFTLAEVLIALGIIGVVSAMTLPALIASHSAQTNASKLGTTVSVIENALGALLADEGENNLSMIDGWEREFWRYIKQSSDGTLKNGATFTEDNNDVWTIDVNGINKPNKEDKDQFKFGISDNGLLVPQNDTTRNLMRNNYKVQN